MEGDASLELTMQVLGQNEGLVGGALIGGPTSLRGKQSQEYLGHRPQVFQAKGKSHLRRHQPAQGTQEYQVHHEDLERLRDHEHQWGQLHPGRRQRSGSRRRWGRRPLMGQPQARTSKLSHTGAATVPRAGVLPACSHRAPRVSSPLPPPRLLHPGRPHLRVAQQRPSGRPCWGWADGQATKVGSRHLPQPPSSASPEDTEAAGVRLGPGGWRAKASRDERPTCHGPALPQSGSNPQTGPCFSFPFCLERAEWPTPACDPPRALGSTADLEEGQGLLGFLLGACSPFLCNYSL